MSNVLANNIHFEGVVKRRRNDDPIVRVDGQHHSLYIYTYKNMIFSSFLGELRALVSAKVGLEWLECGFHPNKPSTISS
jgi:hypothetical protein